MLGVSFLRGPLFYFLLPRQTRCDTIVGRVGTQGARCTRAMAPSLSIPGPARHSAEATEPAAVHLAGGSKAPKAPVAKRGRTEAATGAGPLIYSRWASRRGQSLVDLGRREITLRGPAQSTGPSKPFPGRGGNSPCRQSKGVASATVAQRAVGPGPKPGNNFIFFNLIFFNFIF